MTRCHGCSRRAILQGIGAAIVVGACSSSGSSLPTATTTSCGAAMECIALGDAANHALATVGGAMIVDTSTDTIMVIRVSQTAVVAVSAICTHAGCSMDFDATGGRLICPCHGSEFGEDGSVLLGPARRALRTYTATLTADTITLAT